MLRREIEKGMKCQWQGKIVTVVQLTGMGAGPAQSYGSEDRLAGVEEENLLVEIRTEKGEKRFVLAEVLSPTT